MTNIRVETEKLQSVAGQLKSNSTSIGSVGGRLLNLGASARTYDNNTFGPQVKAICSEANNLASKNSTNVSILSRNLSNKTHAFLSADNNYGQIYHTVLNPNGLVTIGPDLILPHDPSIWDYLAESKFKFKVPVDQLGNLMNPDEIFKGELDMKFPLWKDQVWEMEPMEGHTELGGLRFGGKFEQKVLAGEAGIGINVDGDSISAGAFAEVTGYEASASGIIGSTDLGVGVGAKVKAASGEAIIGYKDGSVGVKAGVNLASIEGKAGINILGWNIGVVGEIGFKAEIGASVGAETRIALGPFTVGLDIGKAMGS